MFSGNAPPTCRVDARSRDATSECTRRAGFAYRQYTRSFAACFMTIVRQPPSDDGLTHASNVMPVVRSSDAASATVTQSPLESNLSDCPYFPAAQTAPGDDPGVRRCPRRRRPTTLTPR